MDLTIKRPFLNIYLSKANHWWASKKPVSSDQEWMSLSENEIRIFYPPQYKAAQVNEYFPAEIKNQIDATIARLPFEKNILEKLTDLLESIESQFTNKRSSTQFIVIYLVSAIVDIMGTYPAACLNDLKCYLSNIEDEILKNGHNPGAFAIEVAHLSKEKQNAMTLLTINARYLLNALHMLFGQYELFEFTGSKLLDTEIKFKKKIDKLTKHFVYN